MRCPADPFIDRCQVAQVCCGSIELPASQDPDGWFVVTKAMVHLVFIQKHIQDNDFVSILD
jgi:hypothetical protein